MFSPYCSMLSYTTSVYYLISCLIKFNMVVSMDRWRGKVAIVTGAGAGIGAAISEKLVEEGVNVVGLECRLERVEELSKKLSNKKGKFYPREVDITKEEDVIKAFEWTSKNVGPVHILVNNAGTLQKNSLMAGDTEKWRRVFDVNVIGLCIATREAVQIMKANKIDGHIINICSENAYGVPNIPGLNVYPASKHAARTLTETLRQEFNREGIKIKISEVSPGAVNTEITKNSGIEMTPELQKILDEGPILQPEDVADTVIFVLATPPHVQVHGLLVKAVGHIF